MRRVLAVLRAVLWTSALWPRRQQMQSLLMISIAGRVRCSAAHQSFSRQAVAATSKGSGGRKSRRKNTICKSDGSLLAIKALTRQASCPCTNLNQDHKQARRIACPQTGDRSSMVSKGASQLTRDDKEVCDETLKKAPIVGCQDAFSSARWHARLQVSPACMH